MPTERAPNGSEAGFTLIEVLIAMIILAVGLLGLEALGIGAARSISRASVQSEYALTASQELEDALQMLHRGETPPNRCIDLHQGDRLSRTVTPGAPLSRVTVTILPATDRALRVQPYELQGSAFTPTAPAGVQNGSACS